MKTIAIIAPHADDETLGCGGTVARHVAAGDRVHWILMTRMEDSPRWTPAQAAGRRKILDKVTRYLGFESRLELPFAPASLDQAPVGTVVEELGKAFDAVRPSALYIPHAGDAHTDHRVAASAAFSAAKSFRRPFIRSVLAYETVSETEFSSKKHAPAFDAQVFIDVSRYLARKLKAFSLYAGEGGAPPFPRSAENIRALASFRGATAGVRYAEAFEMIKEVR